MRYKLALVACLLTSSAWAAGPVATQAYKTITDKGAANSIVLNGIDGNGNAWVCGTPGLSLTGCPAGVSGGAGSPAPTTPDTANGDFGKTDTNTANSATSLASILTKLAVQASDGGTQVHVLNFPAAPTGYNLETTQQQILTALNTIAAHQQTQIILTAQSNGQTTYTLPFAPNDATNSHIEFNGLTYRQTGGDYSISGTTLTLTNSAIAPNSGNSLNLVTS